MGGTSAINWPSNCGEERRLRNKERGEETHRKGGVTLDLKGPMIYYMRNQCTE